MASTFDNNLRLREMGTGDESGTWGARTNENLELIGEALGFGTEAITTNADTHTTTIADGSTDPGRAMYLKYTGALDSACTITLAPDTISKLWFIENATSGSQNIIIKQGSGATVTIPASSTKLVYSDGAGSGAAIVDALDKIDLGTNAKLNDSGIASANSTTTLTNKSIDSDNNTITNIVNADIKSTAAIAFSKLADLTASRALASDSNGDVSVSAVTSTELGYLDGVSSAIQTQLNAKTTLASVYPVGSIYMNATVSTSPASLLGFGSWTAMGQGRVLVGSGGSLSGSGGATTASTTLPDHTHQWFDGTRSSGSTIDFYTGDSAGSFNYLGNAQNFSGDPDQGDYYTANPYSNPTITVSTLQPYVTVYMWYRTG